MPTETIAVHSLGSTLFVQLQKLKQTKYTVVEKTNILHVSAILGHYRGASVVP
jgi:hypothetical protein